VARGAHGPRTTNWGGDQPRKLVYFLYLPDLLLPNMEVLMVIRHSFGEVRRIDTPAYIPRIPETGYNSRQGPPRNLSFLLSE
jgi:hypothetical protein